MPEIIVKLRYFPLGAIAGPAVAIVKSDIDSIASKHGVTIDVEEVKGKNVQIAGDVIREETMDSTVEDVTQSVITVTTDNEKNGSEALKAVIKKYRSPRTVFGSLGSNEKGKLLVARICDEHDGWC
jgi:hypothetical protein